MKVILGEKSLSSLFRILRQELTTVFPAMWYCFTTTKGEEKWSSEVHVRSCGFRRCTLIFSASFAGFFWALQVPCGVASNCEERHGSTPQIYTTLDHILAHLLVSLWPTKNMQFCRVRSNCAACWQDSFGVLWTVSQASLTDFTAYLSVKAPVKLTNFVSMKILYMTLTQRVMGSTLRDLNRNKTSKQKRVQLAGPNKRKNWRLEKIGDSGTKPVILNIVSVQQTTSTSQQRGR